MLATVPEGLDRTLVQVVGTIAYWSLYSGSIVGVSSPTLVLMMELSICGAMQMKYS